MGVLPGVTPLIPGVLLSIPASSTQPSGGQRGLWPAQRRGAGLRWARSPVPGGGPKRGTPARGRPGFVAGSVQGDFRGLLAGGQGWMRPMLGGPRAAGMRGGGAGAAAPAAGSGSGCGGPPRSPSLPQAGGSLPPEHKDGVFCSAGAARVPARPRRRRPPHSPAWPAVLVPAEPPRHRGDAVAGGCGALSILCGDGF